MDHYMLEYRNIKQEELDNLIEAYGDCVYYILMSSHCYDFEYDEDYNIFFTCSKDLLKNIYFESLVEEYESSINYSEENDYYEVKVKPEDIVINKLVDRLRKKLPFNNTTDDVDKYMESVMDYLYTEIKYKLTGVIEIEN